MSCLISGTNSKRPNDHDVGDGGDDNGKTPEPPVPRRPSAGRTGAPILLRRTQPQRRRSPIRCRFHHVAVSRLVEEQAAAESFRRAEPDQSDWTGRPTAQERLRRETSRGESRRVGRLRAPARFDSLGKDVNKRQTFSHEKKRNNVVESCALLLLLLLLLLLSLSMLVPQTFQCYE